MASPAGIHQLSWFYPLGNTPARSLTQDLTRDSDATILSLGSGDIRHVLFTSHLEPLRSIDITCVDNDISVIARNVLMLSLILEAKDNWEIYYHTKISHQSLQIIHTQAQKLQNDNAGERLRFLDDITLQKVKEVWKTYTTTPDMKTALVVRRQYVGNQTIDMTLLRALAPISFPKSHDLFTYGNKFWQTGCIDGTAKWPNPLFGSQSVMHYGTQPLLGFHLALGSAFIEGGNEDLVATAKAQFSTWAASFRESKTTVAYCWSDALSFAYAVQGFSGYRDHYNLQPLVLEHRTFDVIDSSNLADHIGALNIMVAASPLLCPNGLLRMELLVKKEDPTMVLENILQGDLDTVSAIIGLNLLEHCTNASAASNIDMLLSEAVTQQITKSPTKDTQLLLKFTWRAVPSIMLEAEELSDILHVVYRSMFQSESMRKRMGSMTVDSVMKGRHFPHFHRGSLAHLLRAAKLSTDDWQLTIVRFLNLVERDSDIMMTGHYMQELLLQLYIFKLHSTEVLDDHSFVQHEYPLVQQIWSHFPAAVWITMKIPKSKIELFKVPIHKSQYGSLPALGMVERRCQSQQDFFSMLQMVFGTVRTTGNKESLIVRIDEDSQGWKGTAPMIVSFRVPSWILMVEGKKTSVGFGLQSTIHTTAVMVPKLGLELKIFTTTLDDTAHVFVSKNPPNMIVNENDKAPTYFVRGNGTIRGVTVDKKLKRMVARVDISSDNEKADLLAESEVTTYRINPWEYRLEFSGHKHIVMFSAPTSVVGYKTRVARKSGYLELVANVANIKDRAETSPFPISITNQGCTLINTPRVSLDELPALDLKNKPDWLNVHVAMSFSAAEKKLREASLVSSGNTRLDFKESLFGIYMTASGVQGHRGNVQLHSLNNELSGGIAVMIFVDKLRLDLSNQTVLIDAAILPILKLTPSIVPSLLFSWSEHGFNQIKTDDKELGLWKQVLPAFVERCRTWSHTKDCEIDKTGRIPLSYAPNEDFFCTCGNGKFPEGYLQNLAGWSKISQYCVRAAIAPCFAIPYVEEMINVDDIKKQFDACGCCLKKADTCQEPLKECGRCHIAKYCSRECQKKDWPEHKKTCQMLVEAAAKAKTVANNEEALTTQQGQSSCLPS